MVYFFFVWKHSESKVDILTMLVVKTHIFFKLDKQKRSFELV